MHSLIFKLLDIWHLIAFLWNTLWYAWQIIAFFIAVTKHIKHEQRMAKNKKTTFLDLPPELRVKIYAEAFSGPELNKLALEFPDTSISNFWQASAIVRTHSVIRREALPYYHDWLVRCRDLHMGKVPVYQRMLNSLVGLRKLDFGNSQGVNRGEGGAIALPAEETLLRILAKEIWEVESEMEDGLVFARTE